MIPLSKIQKYLFHLEDCEKNKVFEFEENGKIKRLIPREESERFECTCGLDDIINEEQVSAH